MAAGPTGVFLIGEYNDDEEDEDDDDEGDTGTGGSSTDAASLDVGKEVGKAEGEPLFACTTSAEGDIDDDDRDPCKVTVVASFLFPCTTSSGRDTSTLAVAVVLVVVQVVVPVVAEATSEPRSLRPAAQVADDAGDDVAAVLSSWSPFPPVTISSAVGVSPWLIVFSVLFLWRWPCRGRFGTGRWVARNRGRKRYRRPAHHNTTRPPRHDRDHVHT